MTRDHQLSLPTVRGRGGHFEFVDGLRRLAALAVVLPHVVGLFVYSHDSWLTQLFLRLADYGRSSVEVFFVVSGFAIAYSLRDAELTFLGCRALCCVAQSALIRPTGSACCGAGS
jgi:peptidoglycan/LPS O-acetylase OafA/YrhL